jgi:hypothetical protein
MASDLRVRGPGPFLLCPGGAPGDLVDVVSKAAADRTRTRDVYAAGLAGDTDSANKDIYH